MMALYRTRGARSLSEFARVALLRVLVERLETYTDGLEQQRDTAVNGSLRDLATRVDSLQQDMQRLTGMMQQHFKPQAAAHGAAAGY